ncbi:MAG: flagellar hook-basal body complex protein FliE [Vicinamibacterales bacterium]
MADGINGIRTGVAGLSLPKPAAAAAAAGGAVDFGDALGALIQSVEGASTDANVAVADMLEKKGEVHDAMIALTKAEVALQLTVQVRNKLVQAYQDVMRMPI